MLEYAMSDASQAPVGARKTAPPPADKPASVLHRVCVQCNNVFRVTPDKFDAKQCSNCHKG
jgi:hypothetical protein